MRFTITGDGEYERPCTILADEWPDDLGDMCTDAHVGESTSEDACDGSCIGFHTAPVRVIRDIEATTKDEAYLRITRILKHKYPGFEWPEHPLIETPYQHARRLAQESADQAFWAEQEGISATYYAA